MKKPPRLNNITGITVVILVLVTIVVCAVLFRPGSSESLKSAVVQSVLLALASVTGYWLNSSADQAKKDAPPDAPATVTTTVTTGVAVGDVPKIPDVPAITSDAGDGGKP